MRLLLALVVSCVASVGWADNVLRGAQTLGPGLEGPQRATDGEVGFDGDPWNVPAAITFGPEHSLSWDLGRSVVLSGAALQADDNDDYHLAISDDGVTFREWIRFFPAPGPGLRTRENTATPATARFLKLTATGGDGRFSLSELEVFADGASGSRLLSARWWPHRPYEHSLLLWWLVMTLVMLAASPRLPMPALAVLGLIALTVTNWVVFDLTPSTPDALRSLPFVRAVVALLAVSVVLRELMWRARWPAHGRFVVAGLGLTAAMALWCFLNLGRPQFFDAGRGQPTWLHHYDMRTYFPIAKYFPELRFDGVYAASVLVVADGRNLDELASMPLRDLRTHQRTTVGEAKSHLEAVRARFTDERWRLLREDLGYFRRAMGERGFLASMDDHGGNATPVWFLAARALFAGTMASDEALWRGVIADIALLALAALALGWAFGARTSLLALTLFGAMDFYQFGSNWFGAALRHDWLSLWAIGLALLHKRWFVSAGAVLAWSAWIRAFPALTLFTLVIPIAWAAAEAWRQRDRSQLRETLRPLLKVALGVAGASVLLVGVSSAVFGFDAWAEWLRKIRSLDADNHLNNISLRTYLVQSRVGWAVCSLAAVGGLVVLLRRAPMQRAAAWGVALLPIIFNPANYYLHSMFVLVTLASEGRAPGVEPTLRDRLVWLTLLLMCVASYFTTHVSDVAQHFQQETVVAFVSLGVLAVLERRAPPAALT